MSRKLTLETRTSREEVVYFELFRLKTTPDGVEISAKSPLLHAFFHRLAVEAASGGEPKLLRLPGPWAPLEVYDLGRSHRLDGTFGVNYKDWFYDDYPNVSWLPSPKLGEGFTFTVSAPIALNDVEDYFLSCCTFIQGLYQKHLRQVDLSATFKDVEDGAHS